MTNMIEKIEESISHAREKIAHAKKVQELYDNPLFQDIVVKDYFEKEAIRSVGLYGSGIHTEEELINLQKDMHAIGAFRRFLSIKVQEGRQAEYDLEMSQQQLEEELAARAHAQSSGEELPIEADADYSGNLGA